MKAQLADNEWALMKLELMNEHEAALLIRLNGDGELINFLNTFETETDAEIANLMEQGMEQYEAENVVTERIKAAYRGPFDQY